MSHRSISAAAVLGVTTIGLAGAATANPIEVLGRGIAVTINQTCDSIGYTRIAGPFTVGAFTIRVCQKGITG